MTIEEYKNIRNAGKDLASKIPEVGVGTGRFFITALTQNADIYGFDISRSMVDVLKTKLTKTQQHRISVQNIVDFQYDFKFDLIIAPFRVVMHLLKKYQIFGDYKGNELGSDSKKFL